MDPRPGQDEPMSLTLGDIAAALGAELVGDGSFAVRRLVTTAAASGPEDLVLAIEPAALAALDGCKARAAVVAQGMAVPPGSLAGHIVVKRPRYALARLAALFERVPVATPGMHASAAVDPSARIGAGVSIGAFVFIGPRAAIGDGTVLLAHVSVGADAVIGAHCRLHPGARVGERVRIGDRVIVQSNASIGADGFSYATPEPGSIESARAEGRITAQNTAIARIASLGTVEIGDDVEIGANTAIDRAALGTTQIGSGTKIDNLVQIAHNTIIGQNCLIAAQVGISGSCRIGNRVVLAGQVGIADHVTIGDDAIIMAGSGVGRDVPSGAIMLGYPAVPRKEFFAQLTEIRRLKRSHQGLSALEARVAAVEKRLAGTEAQATGRDGE